MRERRAGSGLTWLWIVPFKGLHGLSYCRFCKSYIGPEDVTTPMGRKDELVVCNCENCTCCIAVQGNKPWRSVEGRVRY